MGDIKLKYNSKYFTLYRGLDHSGVSGSGCDVLEGIVFHDGKCVISWLSDLNPRSKLDVTSLGIYASFEEFWKIHCASHPRSNYSEVRWVL